MKIKTQYNLGDIVTFYPVEKPEQKPIKGMIVDLFVYLGYDIKCNKRTLRTTYIIQSGEQGYHVHENKIISGYRFKRRGKVCEVLQSD